LAMVVSSACMMVAVMAQIVSQLRKLVDVVLVEDLTRENHTREELMSGAYLRDVYEKYGVL